MATDQAPEKPGTLYPKITGNHDDFIKEIKYRCENDENLKGTESIAMTGTVKLHGTHADIVVDSTDQIRLQSRNMPSLTPRNDLYNFAFSMVPLTSTILNLKTRIHTRFRALNPGVDIQTEHPLIMAGEWIGPGIQKDVAITKLPKRLFVIISININNSWVPDEPYGDIHDEAKGIYHISKSGFFHRELSLSTPTESLDALQPLADAVEDECPFGKLFRIEGRGEGIVWKLSAPFGADARFWIKTKGPISRGRPVPAKVISKDVQEQREYAKAFAVSVLNEMRMEQGWQYMDEMRTEKNKKGVVAYLRWLTGDVEVEEASLIKDRSIDWSILRREIEAIGKKWYFERLSQP